MARRRVLLVCPGRGSYNESELGYLSRSRQIGVGMLKDFDLIRALNGQETISDLDSAKTFSPRKHSRGDNVSGLIFACSVADFLALDENTYEIIAVTGNSMGWYTALACAGAMSLTDGFLLCNTMAKIMQENLIGGQIIQPFVDENWCEIPGKRAELVGICNQVDNLYISIEFGGMIVFAGDSAALEILENRLDKIADRFPMRLAGHGGFHSPLQRNNSLKGFDKIPPELFCNPDFPLIDGRGKIWYPQQSDPIALRNYTLGDQVTETYNFTVAIETGLKEFAPDLVVSLGPGNSLGTAIGQTICKSSWEGVYNRNVFAQRQSDGAVLHSMVSR